jgi:hypothetical protein
MRFVEDRAQPKRSAGSQAGLSVFLALLVMAAFVLPSMGLGEKNERLYFDIAFSVLLIFGVGIAWPRRTLFVISSAIAVPAIAIQWLTLPTGTTIGLCRQGLILGAIGMLVLVQALEVFRPGPVTHVRIEGALAVYLLLGMGWAHAYHLVAVLNPQSFAGLSERPAISEWMYYSFSTLTTLGYGDIVPKRPAPRLLAVGEALMGQLYIAVLLARLVALQITDGTHRSSPTE